MIIKFRGSRLTVIFYLLMGVFTNDFRHIGQPNPQHCLLSVENIAIEKRFPCPYNQEKVFSDQVQQNVARVYPSGPVISIGRLITNHCRYFSEKLGGVEGMTRRHISL